MWFFKSQLRMMAAVNSGRVMKNPGAGFSFLSEMIFFESFKDKIATNRFRIIIQGRGRRKQYSEKSPKFDKVHIHSTLATAF